MTDPDQTRIAWASRVPRHKIRRLYESDAQGRLDEELLEDVGYAIYARRGDMFQVREAIHGRVACRECGMVIARRGHMGRAGKTEVLTCPKCGWQITWRAYYESYTGKRLLPGVAMAAFRHYVEHWPQASTPQAKMLLIDRLIHEFHVNQGIAGRPAGENVIQGNAQEVRELIETLAYGPASTQGVCDPQRWAAEAHDPIRLFRRTHSWAEVVTLARELGIPGRSHMCEDKLLSEIYRLAPEYFIPQTDEPQDT